VFFCVLCTNLLAYLLIWDLFAAPPPEVQKYIFNTFSGASDSVRGPGPTGPLGNSNLAPSLMLDL